MNGVLLINKEKGITSQQVVSKLKRILNVKKIGHAGTLDPLATGLLVVLVGNATKLSDYLLCHDKEYVFEVVLGKSSTTEDISGDTIDVKEVCNLSANDVDRVLCSLEGKLNQVPPMYSAIKQNGKKLYELARQGKVVERKAREITIYDIQRISDLDFTNGECSFFVKALVSKGTYIRTLCVEIANRLGYPGLMKSLNRISSGTLKIENSFTLSDVENNRYTLLSCLEALGGFNQVEITNDILRLAINGMDISNNLIKSDDEVIVLKYQEQLVAIYKKIDGRFKAQRVWN